MTDKGKQDKSEPRQRYVAGEDKPVSLRPLDLKSALAALLKTPPPKDGHFTGKKSGDPLPPKPSGDDS